MLWNGGIGTYIRNLLLGLQASSFRIRAIVHPKMPDKEKWLQKCDLLFSKAPIYSVREQIELPFLIPRSDLFFSPHYNIPLVPIRARKRLVTIHDVFHLAHLSTLNWKERLYAKKVIGQAVRKSDAIITDSAFSFSEICKYTSVCPEKIHVIPCGVNRTLFEPEKKSHVIQQIIQKFHLPPQFFLFVGHLKPHKNLHGLLRAMSLFTADSERDISLVIVGKSGGMKHVESIEKMRSDYPNLEKKVLWLSSVDNEELPILYQLAEALVFPSFYEGFGLPALEAMSCGCPVIASDRASLPEVCGAAALYISPDQPREIANAMKQIADNLIDREALKQAGYQNIKRFRWEQAIEKHIEQIDLLVREP
jgi:glycosyltransferase involved in cell wall biosynthesis